MTPQSSCKYNGHGFNDDGVCIYCHEDDGTQEKASDDQMTQPNQSELEGLWNLLDDHFDIALLSDEDCDKIEAYITTNYTANATVEQLKSQIAYLEGKIEDAYS